LPHALERGNPERNSEDGVLELRVFVDGMLVETFFGGQAFITTSTTNDVASANVTSSFLNTAGLACTVTSWELAL
jgi:hypothetical protein